MTKRIPVTVVTGFLGSGKTTLLRHLLTKSGKKLAVMVNEFGSVGLDGDLIRSCGFCPDEEIEGRIVELNNGCLCCTVQEDFLPTMENLLVTAEHLDGIVIETSGLALPYPLLKALSWPDIRSRVHINGVVTLINSEALSEGSPVGDLDAIEKQRNDDPNLDHLTSIDELFSDQLYSADMVLLSRADCVTDTQLNEIRLKISKLVREGTEFLPISYGFIDPELILGLEHEKDYRHDDDDDDDHHHHHHVDMVTGNIRLEIKVDRLILESILPKLVVLHRVVRLKGRVWLPGKTMPLQIQMVGPRLNSWFEQVPENVWKPIDSGIDLVLIGLEKGSIEKIHASISDAL